MGWRHHRAIQVITGKAGEESGTSFLLVID